MTFVSFQSTPSGSELIDAINKENISKCKTLIERGTDINAVDEVIQK